MPRIVIASDAPWVRAEIRGNLETPGTQIVEVDRGSDVVALVRDGRPDLVILDLQIGNMGAGAICRDLRAEQESGRLPHVPIVILLDRTADVFLARRADADAWLPKPLSPRALSKTVDLLLAGHAWTPEAVGVRDQLDREVGGTTVEESEGAAYQASSTGMPAPGP